MKTFAVIFSLLLVAIATSADDIHEQMQRSQPKQRSRISKANPAEANPQFWNDQAQAALAAKLKPENKNKAKNVIFFLGDGMSIATTTAARMLIGGEEQQLSFHKFPHTGLSKTYCIDAQVADSACTSTAYLTGVKANTFTLGVDGRVPLADCAASAVQAYWPESIGKWAQDAGKSTGFVTTTRVTHASPTGMYGHVADRFWEADSNVAAAGCNTNKVRDIAWQLINGPVGSKLNVIMGGGRQMFLNTTVNDEDGKPGKRNDGKNLIKDWVNKHPKAKSAYISNRDELKSLNTNKIDYLFGLFSTSDMPFRLDNIAGGNEYKTPSLSEMTEAALDVLSKNDKGFFIFIEAGTIDHGHHATWANKALDETIELEKAVAHARARFSEEDTLIVVSADHSHTMTISGFQERGNPIAGMAQLSDGDNLPFHTLMYAQGPSYSKFINNKGERNDPDKLGDYNDAQYMFPTAVPNSYELHGGDDVGIWASGPWSHLFSGTIEQSNIPHYMAFASCIGKGLKSCNYPQWRA